ncbi:MAG: hydrogenase maturation nickel metallochaperone HypA [Deltaproteobacteria bacterium]|nr:hydrogenase maturation nickel metallochaperone HypA [Candidatus Anaeroferrophillacea bacterium]
MHEMSLAQGLLSRLAGLAAEHGACRVLRVRVHIGPQAGIVTESFRFGFDVLKGAALVTRDAVLELEADAAAEHVSLLPAERGGYGLRHGEPGGGGSGLADAFGGIPDGNVADNAVAADCAAALHSGFAMLPGSGPGADDLLLMQVELETDVDDEEE